MLAAVSGLGNGSAWPSGYLSSETGAYFLVARRCFGFGSGVGLSCYKQANAKLDGYGSLKIDRNECLALRKTFFFERMGPLERNSGQF